MQATCTLKNNRFLNTIAYQKVDRTPIWLMRQAGRYLPEYRRMREQAGSFMTLCKTPELACEVTLQPLRRFDLDAAIIFSDILTIPDAMGQGLKFVEGQGPQFEKKIVTQRDVTQLPTEDLDLNYVYKAIELVKHELNTSVPLLGFCGSPWTIAAYMIEGRSKQGFTKVLQMVESDPDLLHQLLYKLTCAVIHHLKNQIKAGVDAIMVFDTWGSLLMDQYETFSLSYIKTIFEAIERHHPTTPRILFAKEKGQEVALLESSGCNVIGLDWQTSLGEAKKRLTTKTALQGNLAPSALLGSPSEIKQQVKQILASFGKGPGHVFNLGHGITPNIPPENVKMLVDCVHELSEIYHKD